MAKLTRDDSTVVIPDEGLEGPEYTIKINNKGEWTLKETKRVTLEKAIPALKIPIRSKHKEFQWLLLDDIEGNTEPGGVMAITYTYLGQLEDSTASLEDKPFPKIKLRISTSDEPILTHPRYDEIPYAEKVVLAKIISGNTDEGLDGQVTTDLGIEVLTKIRKGVTAFRDPKVELVKSWTSNSSFDDLNSVGKIDEPPGNDAPDIAPDRSWLFSGVEQDHSGSTYDISAIWELSGRGGWDPDLYSDEP